MSPEAGMLQARIDVTVGDFRLDGEIAAERGEVVAVLGPNGAGKTTALRALAGLLPLAGGHITLDGEVLDAPGQGRFVAPQRRPVGVVFQDYLLFPHLDVLDNVAFGPRCRGASRAASRRRAGQLLEQVGIAELADRRPRHLSGGQAQRVALARALAVGPKLLLLDEPLSALDAGARLETRAALRHHLTDHAGATLLITHDPLDALVLADRLIILEGGGVVQTGSAADVTARPRTPYVARLVGLNLYRGHAAGHEVRLDGGFTLIADDTLHGDAFVAFAPSGVALHRHPPEGSPRNTWPAVITDLQSYGDRLRVSLAGPIEAVADVTPAAAAQLNLAPGEQVWAAVKATETSAYPA